MRAIIIGLAGTTLPALAFAQSEQAGSQTTTHRVVKRTTVTTTPVASPGANSFTESQARSHIAKAGFTHVSKLRKDDAELWVGTAHRHGRTVHVALDFKGNVTTK